MKADLGWVCPQEEGPTSFHYFILTLLSFPTADLAIPSGINPAARMGIKSSSSIRNMMPHGVKTEISIAEQGLKLDPMTWAYAGSNGGQSFSIKYHVGTA